MEGAIDRYLASRGYRPASLKQRRSILRRFAEVVDPATCGPEELLDWWATTEHLAPASRRATLQAVTGLMDWLVDAGVRSDNPARLVRAPTVPRAVPKVLADDEVERLKAAVDGTDLALPVELMLGMGLRIGEVVALTAADRDDGWVRVQGKGGKVAMVPMTAAAEALWADGDPWPKSSNTLRNRLTATMQAAGIVGHSPHSLRRTCATRLARRAPLHVVAAILRHESVSTTTAHYTAVSAEELRAAVA